MNRRDFTRGLASLGLAPALPFRALGAGATGVAVVGTMAERMYFVSWYTARLNKTCSPDMLVSDLKLNPEVAKEVFEKLVRTKIVSAPNAFGISRTVDPLGKSYAGMATKGVKRAAPTQAKPIEQFDIRMVERIAVEKDDQSDAGLDELLDAPDEASTTVAIDPSACELNRVTQKNTAGSQEIKSSS